MIRKFVVLALFVVGLLALTSSAFANAVPVVTPTPAPSWPSTYVAVKITCETPVFNTPAGTPVRSDAVHVGQTFRVDPTPVMGTDGENWTRIFVGGYTNPYIPTACIG